MAIMSDSKMLDGEENWHPSSKQQWCVCVWWLNGGVVVSKVYLHVVKENIFVK